MKIPRNSIIYGTFILTAVSFLCRAIGFFYRIYISQTFGEEGMGIFQLTAPVMSVAYSLCCAGFQTAISRYVAARTDDSRTCVKFLLTGLSITGMLSVFFSLLIYECSNFLATNIILEPRTAPLLRLLALSFPFSSVHCCLNGYYYGKKKAGIPALLQLTEQITRVGGVYLLCQFYFKKQTLPPLAVSAAGTAIAEFGSAILSLCFILPYFTNNQSKLAKSVFQKARTQSYRKTASLLLTMAVPLSISRIFVNLLQSVENIYIPEMLRLYGYTTEESLALFGVLTGMALTVILLPCSFVNSMAVLLLPKISEAQSRNRNKEISLVIKRCIIFCCILGSICTAVFFFGGRLAGNLLFHSKTAGEYIVSLSFICPFLYITASLGSVLHGLGKTYTTLFINIGTLLIRIASVFFLVSRIGIPGYILGLLAGQCFSSICCIISLRKYALY